MTALSLHTLSTILPSSALHSSSLMLENSARSTEIPSSASKVFTISGLHFHIKSWLPCREIAVSARVSTTWRKLTHQALIRAHKTRNSFSVMRDGNDLANALKLPFHYHQFTSQTWDQLFSSAGKTFLNLTHLDISYQNSALAQFLSPDIQAPVLTSIKLACCSPTISNLEDLARNFPHLTSIDVSGCQTINDAAIRILISNYRNLTDLDLAACGSINDEAVVEIAKNCSRLTSLNLWSCDQVTVVAIKTLGASCPHLTSLTLRECHKITPVIPALRAAFPRIHFRA